jgi:hypothetical protein
VSSYTIPSLRTRVLTKIRQTTTRNATFSPVEVVEAMRDTYFEIQSELPLVHAYTPAAGSILASANTFVLPTTSSAEYRGAVRMQLVSDNRFLQKLDNEEMDAFWNRQSTTATSRPWAFALYNEDDQEVQGRCHPRCKDAEVYNLWRALVPADFDLTAIGSTSIRLNRFAASALVLKTAAALVDMMDEESLKARRINPKITQRWDAAAAKLIYETAMDMHSVMGTGRYKRNVA